MHEQDDMTLLRNFAHEGSEEAFAAIVARHVNKVYSVALRHVRNPHQAEEITQAVFVILAQKAPRLKRQVILSGWLYNTARLTAVTFVRSEIRRARREKEAQLESQNHDADARVWSDIAPLLDDAVGRLNEKDRHAIVLRFFDGKSVAEVGAAIGLGEAATKMRVGRALEKLRAFFSKRGIAHSGSALAAAMAARSVHASPPALAASIAAGACAAGGAGGGAATIVKGVLTAMAWTKIKTTIVTAIIVGSIVTPVLMHQRTNSQIRLAEAELERQRGRFAGALAERERQNRLAREAALSQKQIGDLARLRKENSALRERAKDLPKVAQEYRDLRAKLSQDNPSSPEQQKEFAMARMKLGRTWLLAFFEYANDHSGYFPTNFDQAAAYVPRETGIADDPGDHFAVAFQGSQSTIAKPSETIVLRGTEPWSVTSEGQERWANAYVFADGHAEIHSQTQGDFSDYESQHTVPPTQEPPSP